MRCSVKTEKSHRFMFQIAVRGCFVYGFTHSTGSCTLGHRSSILKIFNVFALRTHQNNLCGRPPKIPSKNLHLLISSKFSVEFAVLRRALESWWSVLGASFYNSSILYINNILLRSSNNPKQTTPSQRILISGPTKTRPESGRHPDVRTPPGPRSRPDGGCRPGRSRFESLHDNPDTISSPRS